MGPNLKVITGLFGKRFSRVHPAPLPKRSYVFTNNPTLKNEVQNKGWIYVHVDKKLVGNYQISSLQSKYVKFLEVVKDYPDIFKDSKAIIYVDHKNALTLPHIKSLLKLSNPGIIIRTTPRKKMNVYHELNASCRQTRYRRALGPTQKWIEKKIDEGYIPEQRVCNTGLMLYNLECPFVKSLTQEIYEAVCNTKNPCCQIFWTILSQRYEDKIKIIPFNYLPMSKFKRRGRRKKR